MNYSIKKQVLIVLLGFSPLIASIFAMLAARKEPVIYDGDYTYIGIFLVMVSIVGFAICAWLSYRNVGFHYAVNVFNSHKTPTKKTLYVLKMVCAFTFLLAMMFFSASSFTFFSIKSKENNYEAEYKFKVEKISCSRKTMCSLRSLRLYSYEHKDEFYLDIPKRLVTNDDRDKCIYLKGHRNKYGAYFTHMAKNISCKPGGDVIAKSTKFYQNGKQVEKFTGRTADRYKKLLEMKRNSSEPLYQKAYIPLY